MPRGRRYAIAAVPVLVIAGTSLAWGLWPGEPAIAPVPAQLEELDEPETGSGEMRAGVVLSAQGPLAELRIADQTGRRIALLIQGKESFGGKEGQSLRRALNRWELPATVDVYVVGDAGPVPALLGPMIEREFVGPMRAESRFPIYVDFGSTVSDAYKMPKGHLGLVVLDEAGEVALRHSGDADEATLERIREALDAREPPAGPRAPSFSVAGLDPEACAGSFCTFVFLDERVERGDIPGIEGGFEGSDEESFAQIKRTSIRLLRVLLEDWEMKAEISRGVVVGEMNDVAIPGWRTIAPDGREAKTLREAFELPPEPAALVVVDRDGRIAFRMSGEIPFFQLGNAAELMGIEGKPLADEADEEDD